MMNLASASSYLVSARSVLNFCASTTVCNAPKKINKNTKPGTAVGSKITPRSRNNDHDVVDFEEDGLHFQVEMGDNDSNLSGQESDGETDLDYEDDLVNQDNDNVQANDSSPSP